MKLTHIYIAILTILSSTSCSDILDTAPTDAVVDTEIYKSTDNIKTVIEGTWRYLNDTYFTYANPGYTAFMRTSDAMGSDVAVTTKYGYRDPYTFNEMINSTAYRVTSLRSEEHTSELQSREKIVCRLLLEKKKDKLNLSL